MQFATSLFFFLQICSFFSGMLKYCHWSLLHLRVLCNVTACRVLLSSRIHQLPKADLSYRSKLKPSSYLNFLALLFVSAH